MDVTILMAVKADGPTDDLLFVMMAQAKADPETGCSHEFYTSVSAVHTLKGTGELIAGNPYSLFGAAVREFTGKQDNTIHTYHGSSEGLKMWN